MPPYYGIPQGLGELAGPPTDPPAAESYVRSKVKVFRAAGPLMFKDWQLAVRLQHDAEKQGRAIDALRLKTLAQRLQQNHERWANTVQRLDSMNAALRTVRLPELGVLPAALIGTLAVVAGAMWYTLTQYVTDSTQLKNERNAAEIRARELALLETGKLTPSQYTSLTPAPGAGPDSVAQSQEQRTSIPDAIKWAAVAAGIIAAIPVLRDLIPGRRRR